MYKESAELLENAQTEARDFDSLETRLSPLYKKTDLVARAHGVFLLGNVRVRLKELAQAIARYDELIGLLKLNEKWEDKRLFYTAVYNRGVARYFQAFDWERDSNDQAARQAYKQARDDFRKVVDDKGENNDAGYARNLAGYRAEILAGNYAQAASDFQTARSLITAPPRTNARLLFLLDDYADALLNELDRNSSLADLVKDQLAQQAILAYREAIKLNPEWEADALYSIAVAVWHKSQCKQGRGNCAAVCQELKAATQASRPPSPKTKSDIEKLSSDCNCK
jgi:tetratricopeptide (TPR) repeat protein